MAEERTSEPPGPSGPAVAAGEKIRLPYGGGWLKRFLAFAGPAYLIGVGYMDPGNWATDIEAGSRFGYSLLWVLLAANGMALLLQSLSARLGIVTGFDLAQACRREYSRPINVFLWALAEVAIIACDLAEVLGTVIALKILFGLPLLWGCAVAAFDTALLLVVQRLGIRKMEAFIICLVGTVGVCLLIEVFLSRPSPAGVLSGLVPSLPPDALLVAVGMLGATVMPHNLYLHSSLVQSRAIGNTATARRLATRFNLIDSAIALNAALLVNVAILLLAAAAFHGRGVQVTELEQAHSLLEPILGSALAPLAFGIALLAAGQSSTVTGTLAGQIVMEGFLNLRLRPWVRRLFTRGAALIPAAVTIAIAGDGGTYKLLILSQVVLSLQLPFAIIPLIQFTGDRRKMGPFASGGALRVAAWITATIIIAMNLVLAARTVHAAAARAPLVAMLPVALLTAALLAALAYLALRPLLHHVPEWQPAQGTDTHHVALNIRTMEVRSIGVAVEHKSGDAELLSAALWIARQNRARVTLVHVVETPGTMVYGGQSGSLHSTEDERYLEGLARELEQFELHVETMLRFGAPVEQIIASAKDGAFELLVMGAHGHKGIQDLIHGSTTDQVRHAVSIPVLIVHTAGQERPQHRPEH